MIAFNVAQLMKALTGTVRRVTVDETDDELAVELAIVSPVKGELRLMRTTYGVLVSGELTCQTRIACSRCLEESVRGQHFRVDDEFLPVVDVNTGLPMADENPEAFKLTPDHLLDLSGAIRQYAILETPLQPLCREDCQGLCEHCGANLNEGPCGCGASSGGVASGPLGSLLAERMRQAGFKPKEE